MHLNIGPGEGRLMAVSSIPTSEPPQATILRRFLCLFNPTKKDNFSDVYICPFQQAGK